MRKTSTAPIDASAALEQIEGSQPDKLTLLYSCTLVTPMYGGGVNAGHKGDPALDKLVIE